MCSKNWQRLFMTFKAFRVSMKCVKNLKGLPGSIIELFFVVAMITVVSFHLSWWCSVLFYVFICLHGELWRYPSLKKNKTKQLLYNYFTIRCCSETEIHNSLHIWGRHTCNIFLSIHQRGKYHPCCSVLLYKNISLCGLKERKDYIFSFCLLKRVI